jgi:hypothetical protein
MAQELAMSEDVLPNKTKQWYMTKAGTKRGITVTPEGKWVYSPENLPLKLVKAQAVDITWRIDEIALEPVDGFQGYKPGRKKKCTLTVDGKQYHLLGYYADLTTMRLTVAFLIGSNPVQVWKVIGEK